MDIKQKIINTILSVHGIAVDAKFRNAKQEAYAAHLAQLDEGFLVQTLADEAYNAGYSEGLLQA